MTELDAEDIATLRGAVAALNGFDRSGLARDVGKIIEKAEHGQHPDT